MDFENLAKAIGELDEESALPLLREAAAAGREAASQAMEACRKGMDIVGSLFEEGEYFVGDLIFAGELMTEAAEILKSALVGSSSQESAAKMIICTVQDDLHDIGKNIVKAMLEAAGFQVIDLGTDTDAQTIIEAAKAEGVDIIALSGVLTLSLDSMESIISVLRKELPGCRVIIGGAPVSEEACKRTGADEWAQSPQKTVNVCRAWAGI